MKANPKTVNIQMISETAGVSTATVSNVLNGKMVVSEAKRERVLAVADELGYRLNSSIQDLARRGRNGLTRNIAFVLVHNAFGDPAYARALDGVSRAVEEFRLHLILDRLRGDEARVVDLPPVLRDERVDGILVTGMITELVICLLDKLGIPYVVLGAYPSAITGRAINVRLDTERRMHDMVGELLRRGRRRIAYFTEDPKNYHARHSLAVFKEALREHGLPVRNALIHTGTGSFSGAFGILKPVFAQAHMPFDAMVCLDYRNALEIACLLIARGDGDGLGKPRVLLAAGRPFDYYRLPVPAIYGESDLDRVAYEGVKALMEDLKSKRRASPRQILLQPAIQAEDDLHDFVHPRRKNTNMGSLP